MEIELGSENVKIRVKFLIFRHGRKIKQNKKIYIEEKTCSTLIAKTERWIKCFEKKKKQNKTQKSGHLEYYIRIKFLIVLVCTFWVHYATTIPRLPQPRHSKRQFRAWGSWNNVINSINTMTVFSSPTSTCSLEAGKRTGLSVHMTRQTLKVISQQRFTYTQQKGIFLSAVRVRKIFLYDRFIYFF